MNKEEAVYREMEYDSAIKAWHSSTCSNMEGTRAHHTNGRKPEREGQTRYNPAIKHGTTASAATWTEPELTTLTEGSQKEKDKRDMTHMWDLKHNTKGLIYKTDTDLQR